MKRWKFATINIAGGAQAHTKKHILEVIGKSTDTSLLYMKGVNLKVTPQIFMIKKKTKLKSLFLDTECTLS